jgi:hypothetical protein
VITGFNTDIVHDGVTYHVQTEDKGLDSPLLLTLVYTGGTILASKRSPYDDLIAEGFNEKTLGERLQRQHKLICAAIRAGRIEELKLMTQREAGQRSAQKAERKEAEQQVTAEREQAAIVNPEPVSQSAEPLPASEQPLPARQTEAPPLVEQAAPVLPFTPRSPSPQPFRGSQTPIIMRPAPPDDFAFAGRADAGDEIHLQLIEDRDFHAGDVVALRIRVSRGAGGEKDGVSQAAVTVKVLGTTFRPLICSATTDREGMAVVFTTLPRFTSGRAAILIRVVSGSHDAEMRRIILPSR